MSVHFKAIGPRAAAAVWPYPHRTIAEIDRLHDHAGQAVGFRAVPWLPREDNLIRTGIANGMTFAEIAACLPNRSRDSCIGRARRLGLAKARNQICGELSETDGAISNTIHGERI